MVEQRGYPIKHIASAVGQVIRNDRKVYFSSCGLMVQELLIAKRDLKLSRVLKRWTVTTLIR